LHIGDPIRLGAEDPEKGLRMHSPRPDLDVVRLLDDAAAVGPVPLQIENEGLKVQERLRGVSHEREIYHDGGIEGRFSENDMPTPARQMLDAG